MKRKALGPVGHGKFYSINSLFEEWAKTLELVSDPVARHVLSARIAADLAGRGIEVNGPSFRFGGPS